MPIDRLSQTLAALADPTRRQILSRLAKGEATVSAIAAPFDMTLPAISKHLSVLERAGLIERGRRAQWRPCRLRAEPLREASEWIGTYREHWEQRFDQLGDYLHELQMRSAQDQQSEGRPSPPHRPDPQEGRSKPGGDHP